MAWDEVLLAFQIVKNYSSVQEKEGGLVGNYTIDKKKICYSQRGDFMS